MQLQFLLPLCTYPDPSPDAVAENAAAVAGWLDARLHVLALRVDIPPVSNALSRLLLDLPERIREAEQLSRRRGEDLTRRAVEEAGRRGVPVGATSVATPMAFMADKAAEEARYFDLVLCGWQAGNPTARSVAEAAIFGSGRPVLLMPESAPDGLSMPVAVAWDGSRAAARACADARPFLGRASKVVVLSVTDEKPLPSQDGAERLAETLRARGLAAESRIVRAEDCPIAVSLQEHALEAGASLLVMGGYGHSKIREFVLGGATEGVLTDLRLPVLLSH